MTSGIFIPNIHGSRGRTHRERATCAHASHLPLTPTRIMDEDWCLPIAGYTGNRADAAGRTDKSDEG